MKFKEMRQKMGFTLTQVSKIFGIPYSTLQKWEYGLNEPPKYVMKMMWVLYEVYTKDLDEIMKEA